MPTGYTAAIADGITFQKFLLQCARNFGALILMRDDPMDEPIPEEFKPSDYNEKALKAANDRIDQIKAMTALECSNEAAAAFDKGATYHREAIAKDAALKAKYDEMLKQVEAWTPPSPDHENLKKFMREQITESIRFDCGGNYHEDALAKLKLMTGEEWRKSAIETALNDVAYHSKAHKEECERTANRNEWARKLRESIKPKA